MSSTPLARRPRWWWGAAVGCAVALVGAACTAEPEPEPQPARSVLDAGAGGEGSDVARNSVEVLAV
ncbi:MAG: hypothetical protein JJU45_16700, partial [Acidimicrobiia bacterium]|nr:hypothetical protein [Acidimicrobiia bacterium]